MKMSEREQNLMFRLSSFSHLCSLLGWRLAIRLTLRDITSAWKRYFYCSKGWHYLTARKQTLKISPENLTIKTEFLECLYCHWLFFPSVEEKRNYLAITGHNKKQFRKAILRLKK